MREVVLRRIGWLTVTLEFRNSSPPVVADKESSTRVLAGLPRQPSAVMPREPWNRLTSPENKLPELVRLNPLVLDPTPVKRMGVTGPGAETSPPAKMIREFSLSPVVNTVPNWLLSELANADRRMGGAIVSVVLSPTSMVNR